MKIRFQFYKRGEIRYISHLDLMRVFQRAIRRAKLPFVITSGFNPHIRISLKRALKLGVESSNEEASLHLGGAITESEFMSKLNEELPNGVKIFHAEIV